MKRLKFAKGGRVPGPRQDAIVCWISESCAYLPRTSKGHASLLKTINGLKESDSAD